MDVAVQYLTFNISYVRIPDKLSIDEHCTHNNEYFGGCEILRFLQGLEHNLGFPSVFQWGDFFCRLNSSISDF